MENKFKIKFIESHSFVGEPLSSSPIGFLKFGFLNNKTI